MARANIWHHRRSNHFDVKTKAFQAELTTRPTRPSTTRLCQNSSRSQHPMVHQWFINGSSPSRPDPKSADPSPLEKKEEFREAEIRAKVGAKSVVSDDNPKWPTSDSNGWNMLEHIQTTSQFTSLICWAE